MASTRFTSLYGDNTQTSSQTQQQDNTKVETKSNRFQSLYWDTIKPAESLRESLKDEEEYTALSKWQIKSWAKKVWNFFDNAWHTVTDKDEEKWILDYSQYKQYKSLLDKTGEYVDKTAVYQQMATEWVIDFDKFTAYEKEHEGEIQPFEKYKSAVEDIKWDFNNKISNALSPYMTNVDDSYQLNAMTKAIERMNNQFGMFVDSYADTYKSTRDEKLLENFNDILAEYSNDIIKFTSQWAGHLVNEWQKWMWAYYNTLNDAWMREIANNITRIQQQAENKMAAAAIKDNFWDSWEAFKKWNLISSVAELALWAINSANWVLDKAGNVIEEAKQTTLWWYDVVEELNHLNVYSNDAWALEKAFGTMWSWVASIVDAAPTLWPVVIDLLVWSKTWVTSAVKWAKWVKLAKTTQWAERVDDVVNAIFKWKKSYKKIAKAWDLIKNAEEWSTLWVRYLKNLMDDILLFDIGFQQFEWRPMSDDDAALNMLFNLPLDMVAAMMTKPMFFKSVMKNTDLITDVISEDALKLFKKAFGKDWTKKKAIEEAAEWYYMLRSLETSYAPTKTFTLEEIKDLPSWEALVNYIKEVQESSVWTVERLSSFWATANDLLLEAETRKAIAKMWTDKLDAVDKSTKALKSSKDMVAKFADEVKAKNNIMYMQNLIDRWLIDAKTLKTALNKSVSVNDWYKELIYAILTDDDVMYKNALQKIRQSWLEYSQTELNTRISRTLWNIINKNPEVMVDWDIVNWYMKKWNMYQNIFNSSDVIDENVFQSRLNAKLKTEWLAVNKIDSDVISENIDRKLETMTDKEVVDITDIFEDSWLWKFIWEQDATSWLVTEEWTNKYLWKQDPKKVWFNSIINNAWFKIDVKDTWISIVWDRTALLDFKNSVNNLNKVKSINWISKKDWNAYRVMFFEDYMYMFQNKVSAKNAEMLKKTWYNLTDKELEWLAENQRLWTDMLYDEVKWANKEIASRSARDVKAWMDVEEVNSAFKASLEWETNAVDVEQKASKAVIKHKMFNPTIKDWQFDRQSLKDEIKDLFKQRTSKIVPAWEGNKWYATVREETFIMTDEDVLDSIADKIIDTVDVFKTDSLDDKKAVYEVVSTWFSTFAMTPQTAVMLSESPLDFYGTLLWRIVLDDRKATTRYVRKMDNYLNTMKKQFKTFDNLKTIDAEKAKELYEYNGKIGNLKAWMLQIEEWINQLKQYINNEEVWQLLPWVKEQVIDKFNKLTNWLFSKSDYEKGLKLVNKKWKTWISKAIKDWKDFVLKDLTNNEIDDIADFLAINELKRSNYVSKKFYDTLVNWYKKWFEAVKANTDWMTFKLNWLWDFKFNNGVELWTITDAFILWSISNENLAASAILHEAVHQDISRRWASILWEELSKEQMKAITKWEKQAEQEFLNSEYMWWSMYWHIKALQEKLKDSVIKLNQAKKEGKWADYVNSFLYNYSNQYTRREIRDNILNKYSKENLVNMLAEKYNNIDVSSWDLYLNSFIDDEDIKLIEELIVEYSSLAALWEAWYKFVNAPYINEALWVLENASQVIDKFRILAAQKVQKAKTPTQVKEILSATFNSLDMSKNKNIASRISDFISSQIVAKYWATSEWDWIKYIRWIQRAMWTSSLNPEIQSAYEMKSSLLTNISEYISRWVKSDGTKLNAAEKKELKTLSKYIDMLDDEETIYFLDMIEWVHVSPRKVMEDFPMKAPDWTSEWTREIIHKKNISKVEQDILDIEKWEDTSMAKAVNKVVDNMLSMWKWEKAVPALAVLSSMAWNVWLLNWKYLWAVSRLIGNENAMVDISKVIVWENVHKAYKEYVESVKGVVRVPMDEWTFITNRLVATVLDTYGKYNSDTIKVLNDELYPSQILQLINDLRRNQKNWTIATDGVINMFNLVSEKLWWKDLWIFNISAEEILSKATPGDIEQFNNALIGYLYENLWSLPRYWDDYNLKQVKEKFLWLIDNYLWIEWKSLEDIMETGYMPKVLAWEKLATQKMTSEEIAKARKDEALEYIEWLGKVWWRYELSSKSFLPSMLNFLNDMVDSWIIKLKDWTKRADYLADVIGNLDKKMFRWFADDYYELINKFDWIDIRDNVLRTNAIDLYRKFCDKRSLKFSTKLHDFADVKAVRKQAKSSATEWITGLFWWKAYKDFDNIIDAKEIYTSKNKTPVFEALQDTDNLLDDEAEYWYKNTLEDFIEDDDLLDEYKYSDVELNGDDAEINFGFRNSDGEMVLEKAETMRRVDENFMLNWDNALEEVIADELVDEMLLPYRLKYQPSFIVDDNVDSKLAKQLDINLWVYYNSIKWVPWANKQIDSMLKTIGWEAKEEDNIVGKLWNKVKSFKNGNFTDGNPVQIANNFWVDKLIWKRLNWWTIAKVNVRLGNGVILTYRMKDWKLINNIKDMNTTKLMYWLLPAVSDKWATVRFVSTNWKQLLEDRITKSNIWNSFIWRDIVDKLGVWWVERNINEINADEYRKILGLSAKWLEDKLSAEDMIEISKAIWAENIAISNDEALKLLYWKARTEETWAKQTKVVLTDLKEFVDTAEEKVDLDKKLKTVDKVLAQLDAIKNWIKRVAPRDAEWKLLIDLDVPYQTFKEKVASIRINDKSRYVTKDGQPFIEGVSEWDNYITLTHKKISQDGEETILENKIIKADKKHQASRVIIEYPDWRREVKAPENIWEPIGFYQNYKVLADNGEDSLFEEEARRWMRWDYNPEYWYEWREEVWDGQSSTLFNFNTSNQDILNTLTRDEVVQDEFEQVVLDNDGVEMTIRLRNKDTWEEMNAIVRQEDVVNQEYWSTYKEYRVIPIDGEFSELPDNVVMHYNAEDWWTATNERAIAYYTQDDNWNLTKKWYNYETTTREDYNKVVEAAKEKKAKELPELTNDLRRWEKPSNMWERNLAKLKETDEWIAKQVVNEDALVKKTTTIAEDFANTYNTYDEIDNAAKASDSIFSLTNYYMLGNDPYLVELRWARDTLLSNHRDELKDISEDWNKIFSKMDKTQQTEAIKSIKESLSMFRRNNKWILRTANPMWIWTTVDYKQIVNRLAKVFNDEWWKSIDIIQMIDNAQSIDNIIYKLKYSDALSVIWKTDDVHNLTEARDNVFNWAKQFVWEKRAKQLASDFVWDPLGTGRAFRAMANIRSAYRFAKYSILSPVSWTIMYINSKFLWDTLFAGKRKWLEGMLANETFNKIIDRPDVLAFLNRWDDIIANSSSDIMNKGLFVNEWLNKVADTLTKKWTEANETLKTILNWWIHSLYDKQMSGEMRKLAFAQALKENHVYDWQLDELLKSLEDWTIKTDMNKAMLWHKINASSEEFFARFFTNSWTQALSRHKRSRLWWFNFLQGYVINRTDEMLQWFRQWSKFVDDAGWIKRLTWNDIVKHLNEDNQELKSFMNNIIASAKLWYYLDKAADSDGSEADNIRAYFVDTNDYLSSLDTVWFMRLFKAPLEWVSAYKTYSEWSGKEATVIWWVKVAAMESFAEVCSQFFREGKFLNAMLNPIIAGMRTWDLDFAATVAGTEREKMANSLWRFGLVDWMEKYWLEDFSEDSDIIWQMLLNIDRSTLWWQEQNDMYNITNVDKIINDPSYSAITSIWYLPLVWELIKYAADKWWYSFNEAKYKEMMEMVDNDAWLKELYNWKLNTEVYPDEAINRIWNDFTSFNYPYKTMKSVGKHSVWSFSNGIDMTLNTMKEDVFVQNICEKLWLTIEEFHNQITSTDAKKTGKLKIAAAAEAAEPGSGKIVLSYMMANRLYDLEKQYTGKDYPATADIPEDVMPLLKREVLEEYGDLMFTADKASWYKTIREYISEKNPQVFENLYKNETLNSYVWSVWFMDMLMWDAAKKWDVNAKYIKNVFWVISKYMTDDNARIKMVEHLFWTIDNLNAPQTVKNMAMEWVLAGNIDFYNRLKNSPALSVLYKEVLDNFEQRVWWVMDNVDIQDDRMYRQWNKYTPYTSEYGNDNKKLDDELKNKVGNYYNPLKWRASWVKSTPVYTRTTSFNPMWGDLNWKLRYYEGLIKDYSDRLVKSTWKKYPAQGTENITFKTWNNNRWNIRWEQLSFPKHKSKEYRTNVISNLPGSHW